MKIISKSKIEVYLVENVKLKMQEVCQEKGVSIADGLRRAIEMWIKEETKK